MLSYAYVHFPLEDFHPEAIAASAAAECAGRQAKYWEMHSRLFEDPHDLTTAKFLHHARALGLDVERFQQCLGDEATERVMANRRLGLELGVRRIPFFFLGTVQTNGSVMLTEPLFGTATPDLVSTLMARVQPVERSWWPWLQPGADRFHRRVDSAAQFVALGATGDLTTGTGASVNRLHRGGRAAVPGRGEAICGLAGVRRLSWRL